MTSSQSTVQSLSVCRVIDAKLDTLKETLHLLSECISDPLREVLQRQREQAENEFLELLPHAGEFDAPLGAIFQTGSLKALRTVSKESFRGIVNIDSEEDIFIENAGPEYILEALDYFAYDISVMNTVIPLCYKDKRWFKVLERVALSPLVLNSMHHMPNWTFSFPKQGFRATMENYPEVAAPLLTQQFKADPKLAKNFCSNVLQQGSVTRESRVDAFRKLRACGAELDESDTMFTDFLQSLSAHDRITVHQPCSKTKALAERTWEEVASALHPETV